GRGPAARDRLPSPGALSAARARVGALRLGRRRVALTRRGASLDLDAFGKGVALDRIARRLGRAGDASALLNFGESSLMAVGRAPRGGWPVALRDPSGGFPGTFTLSGRACSTSA